MNGKSKLALLGGGLALGAFVVRASAARAAAPSVLVVDDWLKKNRPAQAAVSRRFDPLFRKYGRGLPVAYLRSLAKRESNLNPNESDGPAWGLLQVVEVVRRDFNERHGTSYARRDLWSRESTWASHRIF